MKITNKNIAKVLIISITLVGLVLPSTSYANDWRNNRHSQVTEQHTMQKLVVGGLALLGLVILANSGGGEVESDNESAEYYYESNQSSNLSYTSSPESTTHGFYGNCRGALYGC